VSDTPSSEPALPLTTDETDVLPSSELETAEPRGPLDSAALDAEADFDLPMVLDFGEAGTYELEHCLGRGGMGEVYRARQVGAAGFSQFVAIKRLRPGSRRWEARSFVDEARILSRLHHENIARVYAFHEWQGSYYLVMEYIEGRSLHALLELARKKGHRFSESVACAVMAEVADALHFAHEATDEAGRPLHIVHRDVSPTNIVIANTGRVVLLDFGVALSKQEGRIATRTGATVIKGKAPYLSPEQVKHLPLDARSDLFSVGTILVELLIGEAPFGWTADLHTLRRIDAVTPEYVASLLPGVSKPLRALCQKLLAHYPDQRFATGREVATALRHCAGLGEGQQSVRAEVERIQALPDAKAPPAAEAAARALSEVKHAQRFVVVAGALVLAAMAFASWYVPHQAVLVAPLPPLHGPPAASLPRPSERSIAPAPPTPRSGSRLVGKAKREDGAAVSDGAVAAGTSAAAAAEHVAPADIRTEKKTRVPPAVTAPLAERRTGGTAHVSVDSGESRGTLRDKLLVVQNATVQTAAPRTSEPAAPATASMPAPMSVHSSGADGRAQNAQLEAMRDRLARLEEQAAMPDHAVAALLMSDRPGLTSLVRVGNRPADRGVRHAQIDVYVSSREDETMVAVVVSLKNPRDAATWEPTEAVVKIEPPAMRRDGEPAQWGRPIPAAVRSVPQRILPGQSARIAVVFDKTDVALARGPVTVELQRDGKGEFEFALTPADLLAMSTGGDSQ
jgi:predicted Ser/Thr protein kinase